MTACRPCRLLPALSALLLVSACAFQRTVPGTAVPWDARREALLALPGWDLRGRIGVKSPEANGQGSVEWRQAPNETLLRVSGPFGVGAWELRWTGSEVTLTDGDGRIARAYSGPDALNRLLASEVGWRFPADSTRFWVLGIPSPNSPSRLRYGSDGWLAGIDQDGWRVIFDDYRERSGFWMPRKVTVQGEAARLRLVVDRWDPAP